MSGEGPSQALPVQVSRTEPVHGQKRTLESMTPAERRALAVLTDPAMYAKTDTERMRIAKVGRSRWYQIVNSPDFAVLERDLIRTTVRGSVGAVLGKCIKVAVNTGPKGHADRRLLLEMSGHYEPRRQVDHLHTIKPIGVIVGIAVEEL